VRSGPVTTDSIAVLAAGVGLRHRSRSLLRSVSFRMNARPPGGTVLGIAGQSAAAPRERASVAAGVRELARNTIIIAAGHDATTLRLTCDEVLTLSDGILAGS